jgi:hypothetical protein
MTTDPVAEFDNFIQDRHNELANNPTSVLKEMSKNIPKNQGRLTQKEYNELEQFDLAQLANGSIVDECKHASAQEREATLQKQRQAIDMVRKQQGLPPISKQPAPRKAPPISQYQQRENTMPQYVKDLINEVELQGFTNPRTTHNHRTDDIVAIIGDNIVQQSTTPRTVSTPNPTIPNTPLVSSQQTNIANDEIIETIIL